MKKLTTYINKFETIPNGSSVLLLQLEQYKKDLIEAAHNDDRKLEQRKRNAKTLKLINRGLN